MFAVVSGAAGASVSAKKLLCLSIGSLLASSFSMGFGEYVSLRAETDFVNSEKAREEHEIEHCPELEKQEMIDIYMNRYMFSGSDARTLVDVSFRNKDYFLRHMMVEELGIMLEDDSTTPLKKSFIMALSFLSMGLFPLGGYLVLVMFGNDGSEGNIATFTFTTMFTLLGAATLGFFKGKYLKQNGLKSALSMTFNSIVVGVTSYVFGLVLSLF
ncbi:uncharacterized protein TOT_040000534 [Theileria orientalis strain Shintoku]|uniref:Integral membrane protein n=1 Tax=Theileria orientalis strain Shintoku TaxID=869250 RepID=J4DQB5_THEOR|nr:uncharacterized protein TOT_040000534 [Theileria orientalis strain Shintoku]BAM42164.1 uncharacterized protein TOT_040000534 [Theileria orientalis strain Shintoku]|eukprot:XP_009692465.1 uncharacterized protein TOT_040000534 [Theileria orientalis strain Shintoku]